MPDLPYEPIRVLLHDQESSVAARWEQLQARLVNQFGKAPGIEGILFLIGVQTRGRGFEPDLDKDAKEALVMEGTYSAFATLGLYEPAGMEANGSWIWARTVEPPVDLSIDEQELLLKIAILRYFDQLPSDV